MLIESLYTLPEEHFKTNTLLKDILRTNVCKYSEL